MYGLKRKKTFFEVIFFNSWWVFFFLCLSFVIYLQLIKEKNKEIYVHKVSILSLEKQKSEQLLKNNELKLMINSLSDPAWIEMILIRDLGVVPEGKLKVHFTDKN